MEEKEYIDFNDIKEYVNIKEEKLFLLYLREIFRDLADRDESNKRKGIIKMIFFDYIKLPIFIAEKVFNVFDKDKDSFLNQKEFIYGMNRLYNGNFDETLKLIFEILDFNHDEYIEKDDVKMILGLLPLKTDKTKDKIKYKYQMESLEEIQQIINLTFDNKKILNLEEFKDIVTKRKSDVFLQIICFLYQKKPFTDSNISVLSTSKKASDIENTPQINKKNKCDNVLMPSPLQNSTLSPFQQLQSGHIKSPFSLTGSLNVQEEFKPEISGFKGMIRYHNRNIPKAEDTKNGEMEDNGNDKEVVNQILKNVENVFNSPSTFLKESNEKAKTITPFSLFSPESNPKVKSDKNIPEMNLNDAHEEDKAKY